MISIIQLPRAIIDSVVTTRIPVKRNSMHISEEINVPQEDIS